jgi:NAD(P)-dependent dehydrogenase (short-subunit alcohol dehydrogenase family)
MASVSIDLSGTAVLVTGGARGVGRGITDGFLAAGADVVICGRHSPASPVSHEQRTAGFVAADLREPDQVDAMVAATVERLGRLDVVVNNAGGSPYADSATASPRFSAAIIALNLIAPLLVAQRANAVMQDQDSGGCIVNITSLSGMRPSPGTAAYGAAKAGLINLTQTLAMEWAPKVRVNCVSAGAILTELARLHYGDDAGVAAVATQIPLGRLGRPSDVAGACLFLASPLAGYVSGANLVLAGGGERPPHVGVATVNRGTAG